MSEYTRGQSSGGPRGNQSKRNERTTQHSRGNTDRQQSRGRKFAANNDAPSRNGAPARGTTSLRRDFMSSEFDGQLSDE